MKVSWKNANNNDKSEKEKSSSKHEENEVLNNGNSNVGNANPEVISDEVWLNHEKIRNSVIQTYVDSEGRSQGDRLLALKAKSQHQNMNNMSQNQNQNQNHSDVNPRSSNSAGTNGINGDRNTRSSRYLHFLKNNLCLDLAKQDNLILKRYKLWLWFQNVAKLLATCKLSASIAKKLSETKPSE